MMNLAMRSTFPFLSLACLIVACGPADSNNSDNNVSQNNDANNGANNMPGSVTELLPEGYERVAAPRFSPDGTRLAMVATPPGDDADEELITTDLRGGDVEVIVTGGLSYLTTIAWMPDGESLVYGGNPGIMLVDLNGGEPTLMVDAFAAESVDVSPDGTLVTWSVNGGTMITTAPLSAAGTDEHIVGPEGDMPRFGSDGRIAYVYSDGVAVSAPNGDDAQMIAGETNFFSNVAWLDDDTVAASTDFGITAFDLTSGETTDLHEQFATINLDVSPDGTMFALGVNGQEAVRLGSF